MANPHPHARVAAPAPGRPGRGRAPDPPHDSPSATTTSAPAPAPRLPHQAVPGITQLWRHTLGDPAIIIGVVDGPPDLTHPSLAGANVEARAPWWLPATPPDGQGREHGTWTASVIAGRPGSILPGLAPLCRLIMLDHPTTHEHVPDPLSAARAIEELTEAGAHVIQYTLAHHTASDDTHPALKRAITHALEAGVLITAPTGNDYGHCAIAPALLPGVLAVGAHRADGTIFCFSNHGPAYTGHGLVALGEAVLGATPGNNGIKAQKGTCVAVALVTGTAALLLSLQRHLGRPLNTRAVRQALLATAHPCTPAQAQDQTERCLNGYLDLPAATAHLFGTLDTQPAPAPAPVPAHAAISAPARPAPRPSPAATPSTVTPVTITTLAERPHLADARPAGRPASMPDFLSHDTAGRWSQAVRLDRHFPHHSLVATDPRGHIVASGQAIPFALHTPGRDGRLPYGGWDDILLWAYTDLANGTPPDTLCALGIWVHDGHRGTGLADRLLAAMKHTAQAAGLAELVAPVRPTRKHEQPTTPMADYARRTRADGLPADPWLRTHVRAGGRVTGIAPTSMVVAGSLAQWREWTGLPFDADGPVVVPGALVPVQASLVHDHAVYAEPNVWVRHPLPT